MAEVNRHKKEGYRQYPSRFHLTIVYKPDFSVVLAALLQRGVVDGDGEKLLYLGPFIGR